MKLPISQAVELLKQFCAVYTQRDLPALLEMFTQNCNVWGTAEDEYRVGLKQLEEQFKRDWQQSEHCEIKPVSFVPTSSSATWGAGICKALITIGQVQYVFEHLRGTVIIEKEKGIWKIAHMHSSFPDYRNLTGKSFPTIKAE